MSENVRDWTPPRRRGHHRGFRERHGFSRDSSSAAASAAAAAAAVWPAPLTALLTAAAAAAVSGANEDSRGAHLESDVVDANTPRTVHHDPVAALHEDVLDVSPVDVREMYPPP